MDLLQAIRVGGLRDEKPGARSILWSRMGPPLMVTLGGQMFVSIKSVELPLATTNRSDAGEPVSAALKAATQPV